MLSTPTTIVTIARTWLGTPYHHQASLKGVGCDCVGLVRGIWSESYGAEPEPLPAYTRDWAEALGRETLLEAARRHLVEVPPTQAQPGDVLIFRWRRTAPAKHCAILSTPTAMIHALEGAPVSEVSLSAWWWRHLAGVFAFPEVSDPLGLTPFATALSPATLGASKKPAAAEGKNPRSACSGLDDATPLAGREWTDWARCEQHWC